MTALREELIKRGKLFRNYSVRETGEQMFRYESDAISHGSGFQGLKNQQKQVMFIQIGVSYSIMTANLRDTVAHRRPIL